MKYISRHEEKHWWCNIQIQFSPEEFTAVTDFRTSCSPAGCKFSQDIAKEVSFKSLFGYFLILDISIIRSNLLINKLFSKNILQSSKKSPYQRNDEIKINLGTQFFRTTILLYKNDIFININLKPVVAKAYNMYRDLRFSWIILTLFYCLLIFNFTIFCMHRRTFGENLITIGLILSAQ
jgi:hypothetical protein